MDQYCKILRFSRGECKFFVEKERKNYVEANHVQYFQHLRGFEYENNDHERDFRAKEVVFVYQMFCDDQYSWRIFQHVISPRMRMR